MPDFDLGPLLGGKWHQYARESGQIYYRNLSTDQIQYTVPEESIDLPVDIWKADSSRSWPQWRNQRTGRIEFQDPDRQLQSYLDLPNFQAYHEIIGNHEGSSKEMYQQLMKPVLRWLFPESEGFEVVKQGKSDFTVLKICTPPGGEPSFHQFCLVESRASEELRRSVEDDAVYNCVHTSNESKQIYSIVHIGLEIAFHKYQVTFEGVSPVLNLVDNVHGIIQCAEFIKNNPLPFT